MTSVRNNATRLSQSILSPLEGYDLSKLVIPRNKDLGHLIGLGSIDKLQELTKQMTEATKVHRSMLKSFAPQLSEMAELIENRFKIQTTAFQSAIKQLQPFISNAELLSQQLSVLPIPEGLTSDSMRALSTFNSFQRFKEVYEEYNSYGVSSLEDLKTVNALISQNTDLLMEVKEIVAKANEDTLQAGDIPELIYSYLVKKIPFLDKKTYSFIVLLISAVMFTYGIYSNEQMEDKIEEVSSKQDETIKGVIQIGKDVKEVGTSVDNVYNNIETIETKVNDMENSNREHSESLNNKLDMIIHKMRNQSQKK